jgi:putative PEP-CTERM system histidine kinase
MPVYATPWEIAGLWMHLAAAVCCSALAIWYLRTRPSHQTRTAALAALFLTAFWSVVSAVLMPLSGWALLAETARNLGWLWLLYRLFATDGRDESAQPVRPVLISLVFLELFQLFLLVTAARPDVAGAAEDLVFHVVVMFRLLMVVGALVLVHNLYVGASSTARNLLRWPASALAVMWGYDLNFYTIGYLSDRLSIELAALRGLATIAMMVPLVIASARSSGDLKFKPSRAVTFQSLSLLVIGGYLLLMVGLAQSILLIGGDAARLTQVGFVFAASVVALVWLPSERMRRWLRVKVLKHLFQHRYDYRSEWLRFTRTIGRAGEDAPPLHQRVVQVLSDITDSPGGLLLVPSEDGTMVLAARWMCDEVAVPATALSVPAARFFEREGYILDLDTLRAGRDARAEGAAIPAWLIEEASAWTLVPLIHYERLTGIVVLCRPPAARQLDWEDFDLLRVVGQQLASYLAEQSGQEALGEAARFEEFNRRIAFVMHDIKNLASQLSLLARNAERHADKAEFRADMLITLRNSADKLNGLLARLGRYGAQGGDKAEELSLPECVEGVVRRFEGIHPVVLVDARPAVVSAQREALEQALVHLVQNAIDASAKDVPVCLRVVQEGLYATVEVVDSGKGMSPEFVRTSLFKPFVSSKNDGFGIGAFEARELIRAMQGRLDVESREGLGTRFVVSLPLASAAKLAGQETNNESKVA